VAAARSKVKCCCDNPFLSGLRLWLWGTWQRPSITPFTTFIIKWIGSFES